MKHIAITSDDDTLAEDSATKRWAKLCFDASAKMGASFMETTKIKERMEEVGFVDVQEYICKLPIGPWPKNKHLKRVGALELVNMVDGIEGLSLRLLSKVLGMKPEDVQILLMEVRGEVKNSKIHSYYPFYMVFGRKP